MQGISIHFLCRPSSGPLTPGHRPLAAFCSDPARLLAAPYVGPERRSRMSLGPSKVCRLQPFVPGLSAGFSRPGAIRGLQTLAAPTPDPSAGPLDPGAGLVCASSATQRLGICPAPNSYNVQASILAPAFSAPAAPSARNPDWLPHVPAYLPRMPQAA